MRRLLVWFHSLPRAARWGVTAALGVGVYFGVVEPLVDLTNRLNAEADVARLTIDRAVEQAARRKDADSTTSLSVSRFGQVELPAEFQVVSRDLDRAIDSAFEGREVSGKRTSKRRPAPLGRDAMAGALPAGREVQRISAEMTFEASQETVAKVLADLERSPIITQVSDINLRLIPDKKRVQATLVPEAWVFADKGGRR